MFGRDIEPISFPENLKLQADQNNCQTYKIIHLWWYSVPLCNFSSTDLKISLQNLQMGVGGSESFVLFGLGVLVLVV